MGNHRCQEVNQLYGHTVKHFMNIYGHTLTISWTWAIFSIAMLNYQRIVLLPIQKCGLTIGKSPPSPDEAASSLHVQALPAMTHGDSWWFMVTIVVTKMWWFKRIHSNISLSCSSFSTEFQWVSHSGPIGPQFLTHHPGTRERMGTKWMFSKMGVPLNDPFYFVLLSIINHPFWGTSIYEKKKKHTVILE